MNLKHNFPISFRNLRIRRALVLPDLLEAFKSEDIAQAEIRITMVDGKGKDEIGEDVRGIFRDALAIFWEEFYLRCTVGTREKVPSMRHDFQSLDWTAVARILVKGYFDIGYFPLMLSPAFLVGVINGEVAVEEHTLVASFRRFLSKDEEEIIQDALESTLDDLSDNEDLMDFLGRFDCRKLPTKQNIALLIAELAHKELIQKPQYIAESWRGPMEDLKNTKLGTVEGLSLVFKEKEPTTRKVLALLNTKISNPLEQITFNNLKQFIRELEGAELRRFLMFVTGADVICISSIEVEYTQLAGMERRPIAHICGCILELPTTHESYAEFRTEFANILAAGRWQNDII